MQTLTTDLPESLDVILTKFLDDNPQSTFQFRTLNANRATIQVITSDGTEARVVNSARTITGSTIIRTPEGRRHNLVYSVGEDTVNVNGQTMVKPRPEAITFETNEFCIKVVKRTNYELLARLLFADQCSNGLNPAREEPNGGFVYELIQPAKNAERRVIDKEAVLDAQIAVRRASDTELKQACLRLGIAASDDRNDNAGGLYAAAEADPKGVYAVLGDEWDKTTALVRDLSTAGIIAFDDAARAFRTVSDQKAFHNALTGDPEQSLVKYLSDSQGQKTKVALARLLEEKNKKGAKR